MEVTVSTAAKSTNFCTLLSTLWFLSCNLLIQIKNRSSSLLKILVSVVRFRPWAPSLKI